MLRTYAAVPAPAGPHRLQRGDDLAARREILARPVAAHRRPLRRLAVVVAEGPVHRTGPMALTTFIDGLSGREAERVTLLPSCAFSPMSDHWNDGHVVNAYDSISRDCESFDDTYAVHLWSHSWLPPWVQRFNEYKRRVLKSV